MKKNIKYLAGLCLMALGMSSCEYDNYDEPKLLLDGNIVYNGEPIGVSYNDVYFQLWEDGWQTFGNIGVAIDQDGSFSSLLFAGDYKLIVPADQGPFMNLTNPESGSDTIPLNLTGSMNMDIEVLPYYMIRNVDISGNSSEVTANFGLEQIITDANARGVNEVVLYLSKTAFVDGRTSISSARLGGGDIADMSSIQLSTEVPNMTPTQGYVFARVGLRIEGVEDMIFSSIERIDF
ncbi:hypothetical protein DN752_20180 [Echinicola strongylocentroti]|uniref:DUF3823 domain-containing protein n=1 Tax=Echinicola strongylocentroti TaxID=1795355 RepID=A0A2Z4INF1_9BACT|nr:DUF3823 domain-containing protein [Echinicola strongylocentroti]AWW32269.1 hypothetical protein DN752_20180 [Echinicola strongylocentroti]